MARFGCSVRSKSLSCKHLGVVTFTLSGRHINNIGLFSAVFPVAERVCGGRGTDCMTVVMQCVRRPWYARVAAAVCSPL